MAERSRLSGSLYHLRGISVTSVNRLGNIDQGSSQQRPWNTIVAWWIGPFAQVVINAAGGQTATDGLRIHLGNLGGYPDLPRWI